MQTKAYPLKYGVYKERTRMPLVILVILIGIPIIELSLFAEVAEEIGTMNTILLTILTAVIGISLVRQQGLQVMQSLNHTLQQGQDPVKEIVQGVFLFLAGIFLLLPGFMTDTLGALFLIPPVRRFLAGSGSFKVFIKKPMPRDWQHPHHRQDSEDQQPKSLNEDTIIEGQFEEIDSDKKHD